MSYFSVKSVQVSHMVFLKYDDVIQLRLTTSTMKRLQYALYCRCLKFHYGMHCNYVFRVENTWY